MSWLDLKLGFRMLVRYPGLSFAGGLGIVLVILCGTIAGLFDAVINGTLPFEQGDRIVAIENWDASQNTPAPHDLETWRRELKTVQGVGGYRLVSRNVASAASSFGAAAAEGGSLPVRIAEISASAFTIARVPPVLGRYLLAGDEAEGASPVIVIGYDEWQRRFAGDPGIVGQTLQVGAMPTTVVGVMPKGFGFPVNERYWTPLHLTPSDYTNRQAPSNMPYKTMPHGVIQVFGRLADGTDLAAAQAELNVIGQRAAADDPSTHAHVRPQVLRYTRWFFKEQHDGEIFLVWGLLALVLGVVGANVAVLVYARTATRRIEIALRSAIGASRVRIVGQMFVEGLVLSAVAAAVGLLIAIAAQRELAGLVTWEQMPFWVNTSVTSPTVLSYVLGVAVLGAVVVGAIPALQATGRRAQTGLQQAAAGSSAWRIGRTYGVLIVVQVALAVAILPYALSTAWTSIRDARVDPGFAAHEFLTARLDIDAATAVPNRRAEVARRLETVPGVSDVIFLTGVPGSEPAAEIEVEHQGSRDVHAGDIGADFVKVFGIPVLAGRAFDARDLDPSSRHVLVNRTFARDVLGDNSIGRLVREVRARQPQPGPWLEIVGVIEDFPATSSATVSNARLYRPVAAGDPRLALLAVRARGTTSATLATRVREFTAEVDANLLLRDVRSMDAVLRDQQIAARLGAWVAGLATASLLLLSATGLYALMAFTVAQRRREIGIRIALGAHPRAVVRGIVSRALWQLAIGIVIGMAIAAAFDNGTASEFTGGAGLRILPLVAAFVLLIGLAAAAGPARRALSIEPTEALRAQ
jgi:putative ABC transport system permease protein